MLNNDIEVEEVPTKHERAGITSDTTHGTKRTVNEDQVRHVPMDGNDHSTVGGEWTVVAGKKHASKRVTGKKYKREDCSHSN